MLRMERLHANFEKVAQLRVGMQSLVDDPNVVGGGSFRPDAVGVLTNR